MFIKIKLCLSAQYYSVPKIDSTYQIGYTVKINFQWRSGNFVHYPDSMFNNTIFPERIILSKLA